MQHPECSTPTARAIAVEVVRKRLPVFPFSGFDLYHHFRNDAFYDLYNLLKVRKTGKREVVFGQPLPQSLYSGGVAVGAAYMFIYIIYTYIGIYMIKIIRDYI